jgi:hypothetical protein
MGSTVLPLMPEDSCVAALWPFVPSFVLFCFVSKLAFHTLNFSFHYLNISYKLQGLPIKGASSSFPICPL